MTFGAAMRWDSRRTFDLGDGISGSDGLKPVGGDRCGRCTGVPAGLFVRLNRVACAVLLDLVLVVCNQ